MATTLLYLTTVVPTRAAIFHAIDARRNVSHPLVFRLHAAEPVEYINAVIVAMRAGYRDRSPFSLDVHARSGMRVVSADDLDGVEAALFSHYAERWLAPLGLATQTTLLLRSQIRMVGAISLFRASDQAPVTRGQRALLQRSQPMIQEGFSLANAKPTETRWNDNLLHASLTDREAEVARFAAAGATNLEIAQELSLSLATVKTHLNHAYIKLGVRSRTQLSVLVATSHD